MNQQKAIPFIYLQDQKFVVSEQAKQFFTSLKKPLAILTIVGKYRTGKSLFLNKILLKRNQAFKVSPTINSCTKGLWVWKQTIKLNHNNSNSPQDQHQLIVIDSQGFGATQQSDAYNNKILLFALLLSSYFIYNSVGSIDQNSINNLSLIANIAKEIQSKNTKDQKLDQNFPSFMWLVRDFTLNLVNKENIPIKAYQYLQQALQIQKGSSDLIQGKNKIRRIIKHFFKDRDCFTLVRPVQNQEKLQKLDDLEENQFRQVFVQQANTLREKILSNIKVKKLKNCKLNGQMLIELATNYVEVINNGSIPNFQNTYKCLLKKQLHNLKGTILKECEQKIQKTFSYNSVKNMSQSIFKTQTQMNILNKKMSTQLEEMSYKRLKMMELTPQQQYTSMVQIRKEIEILFQKTISKRLTKEKQIYVTKFNQIKQQELIRKSFQNIEDLKKYLSQNFNKLQSQISGLIVQHKKQLTYQYFTPWKEEHLLYFITAKAKQNESKQTKIEQNSIQLSTQLTAQKNNKNQLQKKLSMVQNQRHSLKCHLQETKRQLQKLKQTKQKQDNKNNLSIQRLQNASSTQNQQIKLLRAELSETKINVSEFTKKNTLLQSDKSYLQRQLSILKNSLNSKIEEIAQKKDMIKDIQNEIKNVNQKQEIYVNQTKLQIEDKSCMFKNLLAKYEELNTKFTEISRLNAKLQTQLTQKAYQMTNQKSIFQSVFQTLKENYLHQTSTKTQLLEINKNLTEAVRNLQLRTQQSYQNQLKLKQYKKSVKNSSCIQCIHCTRFFVPSIFLTHLTICNQNAQNSQVNHQNKSHQQLKIRILSSIIKQSQSKPFTSYQIQCKIGKKCWIVNKKYKQLCDLNTNLQNSLPGVQLSAVSYIVNPQKGLKNSLSMDQRKKIIQKYLNQLSQNQFVSKSKFWNQFININQFDSLQNTGQELKLKGSAEEHHKTDNSIQSPEEFFKIWEQRQNRCKVSSVSSSVRKNKNNSQNQEKYPKY